MAFQTKEEIRWLEQLQLDCPKCHQMFGAILHRQAKCRPLMYCPNGCRSAMLRYLQRQVKSHYVLVGGKDGAWQWRK